MVSHCIIIGSAMISRHKIEQRMKIDPKTNIASKIDPKFEIGPLSFSVQTDTLRTFHLEGSCCHAEQRNTYFMHLDFSLNSSDAANVYVQHNTFHQQIPYPKEKRNDEDCLPLHSCPGGHTLSVIILLRLCAIPSASFSQQSHPFLRP